MKTLHLTNAWHAKSGGIGTFYRALMEAANREGHFTRLIVPGEATRTEEAGPFARIYHIKAPRAPINPDYRMLFSHHSLFRGAPVHRILTEEQPDLIEISDKYTMHYLAGLPRVRGLFRISGAIVPAAGVRRGRDGPSIASFFNHKEENA